MIGTLLYAGALHSHGCAASCRVTFPGHGTLDEHGSLLSSGTLGILGSLSSCSTLALHGSLSSDQHASARRVTLYRRQERFDIPDHCAKSARLGSSGHCSSSTSERYDEPGHFGTHGTLLLFGSLLLFGTLRYFGSLRQVGTLPRFGSLGILGNASEFPGHCFSAAR